MTSLINLDFIKLNALPIVAVAAFAGGLYVSHLYHTAIEVQQTKVLLQQVEKQKEIDSNTIVTLQTNLDSLQKSYITLGEKIRETKLTTTPCTVTTDGIKLWNESNIFKASLPTDTKTVIETSNASSGINIEELFQNKLANDVICNGMRAQLESIIKWNEDTYGN